MFDEDKKSKVVKLITDAVKPKRAPRRKPAQPAGNVINIKTGNGDGNGIGNTIIKTENVIHRHKVEVKTGDGVITAWQKGTLQQLVKDWVAVRDDVRKSELSFAAAWSAVNKQAGVNSYHEIPAEKFSSVERWLLKQIAIVNSMPSAPSKAKGWRDSRIKGIQARCNELGIQDKRKVYMLKNFGKDSLTLMSDDEVDRVYRWAMGKH